MKKSKTLLMRTPYIVIIISSSQMQTKIHQVRLYHIIVKPKIDDTLLKNSKFDETLMKGKFLVFIKSRLL